MRIPDFTQMPVFMIRRIDIINTLPLLACTLVLWTAGADAQASRLFDATSEKESTDISAFTKWTKTLDRQPAHLEKLQAQCVGKKTCKKSDWEAALASFAGQSRKQQIRSVNRYINKTPYVQDIVNWGMEDYWETLFEFFTRNGDCEDYAMAKYFSLKQMGFDPKNLRIVILNDNNLRVLHAVLAVYEGDKVYILDNQIKTVLEDQRIHHYKPIYSINEYAWWRHLP